MSFRQDDVLREKLESLGLSLPNFGRLCAAGELAAGISHELQQPLCAITIYADTCIRMLRSADRNDAAIEQALHDLQAQVTRAATIIKRLRRFVRRQPPALEKVRLPDAIDSVLILLDIEAGAIDAAIDVNVDPALPHIQADSVQIEQVILNLIRNGLDAVTADSGERRVTVNAIVDPPGFVLLEVCNPGPAISESVRSRLFDPFFSTKKEGLGMGLYIARMIVEAHGGTIECASDAAQTCFRVRLPAAVT